MLHPILMHELVKARQGDLLREAEVYRRAKQVRGTKPGLHERLFLSIRGLLTPVGLTLEDASLALERQYERMRVSCTLSQEQLTVCCDDQVCA